MAGVFILWCCKAVQRCACVQMRRLRFASLFDGLLDDSLTIAPLFRVRGSLNTKA